MMSKALTVALIAVSGLTVNSGKDFFLFLIKKIKGFIGFWGQSMQ